MIGSFAMRTNTSLCTLSYSGKYIFTTRPNARTATIAFKDNDTKAGKSYYYVRVFQRDIEKPDGDPEVAWTSPWYVTYE